jgi:hypothetical protein
MDGGTWRRLKIAAELRLGHGLPRIPDRDKMLLAGLLAAIDAGQGKAAVESERVQEEWGRTAVADRPDVDRLVVELARRVDVHPYL